MNDVEWSPRMEQQSLIWNPEYFTVVCHLRADGALLVHLLRHLPGTEPATVDRRCWHPPVRRDWVLNWIGDIMAAYLLAEAERLDSWFEATH